MTYVLSEPVRVRFHMHTVLMWCTSAAGRVGVALKVAADLSDSAVWQLKCYGSDTAALPVRSPQAPSAVTATPPFTCCSDIDMRCRALSLMMAGNRVEYLLVLVVVLAYTVIHTVHGAVILALLAAAFAVESVCVLSSG